MACSSTGKTSGACPVRFRSRDDKDFNTRYPAIVHGPNQPKKYSRKVPKKPARRASRGQVFHLSGLSDG
jgi:hypothetical protein